MLKTKEKKGITLIALVITIIILIILASVAIYLSLGNNGIFIKSKETKEETNKQTATEKINLKITTAQMNKYAEKQEMPTLKELSLALKEDNEIDYVTEVSQVASTKYEVGDSPTSIFTKLKEYSYEFEINSSLQLASINGVQIAQVPNKSNESMKVLYDGAVSEGTITFEEDTINDYDYYEFIFGLEHSVGTGKARILSEIVSREFLKQETVSGDILYITAAGGANGIASILISNVTDNSITFKALAEGASWSTHQVYIFKIVGRNK